MADDADHGHFCSRLFQTLGAGEDVRVPPLQDGPAVRRFASAPRKTLKQGRALARCAMEERASCTLPSDEGRDSTLDDSSEPLRSDQILVGLSPSDQPGF